MFKFILATGYGTRYFKRRADLMYFRGSARSAPAHTVKTELNTPLALVSAYHRYSLMEKPLTDTFISDGTFKKGAPLLSGIVMLAVMSL